MGRCKRGIRIVVGDRGVSTLQAQEEGEASGVLGRVAQAGFYRVNRGRHSAQNREKGVGVRRLS